METVSQSEGLLGGEKKETTWFQVFYEQREQADESV